MLLPRRSVRVWLVLSLCLSILVIERAEAQDIVREIVVEGAQRTEASTVQSYLLIQPGDPFDDARIDRSLKSLYATGLFADVSITRDGDKLVVKVVE